MILGFKTHWPDGSQSYLLELKPWVVGENVAGLISMDGGRVFAGILADMENAGYSTEVYLIPAIGVGAPHRRDRVWIVAHSKQRRFPGRIQQRRKPGAIKFASMGGNNNGHPKWEAWNRSPEFLLRHYGLSGKLDEPEIKALGNAIVPQIAYQIFKAINQTKEHDTHPH